MTGRNIKRGITFGVSAYFIWGLLPMYWKLLEETRADAVLAHRIIWSFVFMTAFIIVSKKGKSFILECKRLVQNKKTLLIITTASIIISLNWLIFIWAVQQELVIQVSLGYYINPLMSVLLGVLFLKEKLSKAQTLSCILAAIGVIYLTFFFGVFPWISLLLAITFALYGLLKKIVNIDSAFSLTIETFIVTPIALIYLLSVFGVHFGFNHISLSTDILLITAGIATAVPLLLFGNAVLHLPLSMAGILQYIAPTIMLFIGVFLYGEVFTYAHFVTFTLIWISLILYMSTSLKFKKDKKTKQKLA
ncbi:EamA family transporter RarD [Pseudogracilibacillus auburnensis]|uniref:Chloramphenicol-sensitive protein RarD n=1 Tax=Pseudogracilibacillus auburnensis TaxID=1494959 RepID=A0A2V3W058_9BACI|nr:EamA family transporter RarD [Pseudogracilibacillus auburnensis]MBO1002119.1 EamA family transporter RarD [Pseudogracilibacillus auburnensis]PXW87442.1 chloramphenicol-sensitive protein RarD [Pseudogracilibacillus auburnensis]